MNSNTYFISGGAGFIGSSLARRLLSEGHRVLILDNLSTGSMENIEDLTSNPRFEYTIGDVTNSNLVCELVSQVDCIFHLAAAVGVQLIVNSPVHTIETNVNGTEVVLRAALQRKLPVLLASTSEVYGKSTEIPFKESGNIVIGSSTTGRWAYACSKAIDEFLGIAYHKEKGLPVVVCRFFNTIGPRQTGQYGMVVPRFIEQALNGDDISIYGDGKQTRCFCHVDDITRALPELIHNPKSFGEVFNLGNTEEISIIDLANRIKKTVASDSTLKFIPYEDAYNSGFEDMARRVPCIDKAKSHMGWEPTISLEETLIDIASHKKSKLESEKSKQ